MSNTVEYASANPSTAQTNTALVAAQTGRALLVTSIYVSSDTATTVTISNSASHTVLWRQYVGARGGAVLPVSFWAAWNEGLDYSTADAANVFIQVGYIWRGRSDG